MICYACSTTMSFTAFSYDFEYGVVSSIGAIHQTPVNLHVARYLHVIKNWTLFAVDGLTKGVIFIDLDSPAFPAAHEISLGLS